MFYNQGWQDFFFKDIKDIKNPAILTAIVVYSYNLFYILIVMPWLIDYKFKVPNKQFVISTILFLSGIIILFWALLYQLKGMEGAFPVN